MRSLPYMWICRYISRQKPRQIRSRPSSRACPDTCMDVENLRWAIHRAASTARAIRDDFRSAGDPAEVEASTSEPTEQRLHLAPIPSEEALGLGSVVQSAAAFVSWAHKHPDWVKEESEEWERKIATFAATLRTSGGINADVDLYHAADPDIDWTRYGPNRIEDSDYILIAMSEAWADRWSGRNSPTVGASAVGEADALHGLFTRHQIDWQRRVKIVMFPGVPDSAIPNDLARLSRFYVDPDDLDTYDDLLRSLTAQPRHIPPPISSVPVLSSSDLRTARRPSARQGRRERIDQESLQERLAEVELKLQRAAPGSKLALELNSLRVAIQTLLDSQFEG